MASMGAAGTVLEDHRLFELPPRSYDPDVGLHIRKARFPKDGRRRTSKNR
jgi:hypothetical protein